MNEDGGSIDEDRSSRKIYPCRGAGVVVEGLGGRQAKVHACIQLCAKAAHAWVYALRKGTPPTTQDPIQPNPAETLHAN